MSAAGPPTIEGLELVAARPLVVPAPVLRFRLRPGDRPIVAAGDRVLAGTTIAQLVRDPSLTDLRSPAASAPEPGTWWTGSVAGGGLRGRRGTPSGELLFGVRGQWRLATGTRFDPLEAPAAGLVRAVRPGIEIELEVGGTGLPGAFALGEPARGRLLAGGRGDGDLRMGALDVGYAGAILVVGSRIDAETLTRARATGIRGVVVTGLGERERRDFLASETRQRAGLHRLPPFAVLVLDGTLRRPFASPIRALLGSLLEREVAIATDPPLLLFDAPELALPDVGADWIRARHGPAMGREGTWAGLAGPRRFRGGAHLEAGLVRFESGPPVAVPLADLERFV